MAINLTCDVCGLPAIGRVQVSIIADNVISPDCPTGSAMERDLCAACRPATIVTMLAQAQANLEAAILAV